MRMTSNAARRKVDIDTFGVTEHRRPTRTSTCFAILVACDSVLSIANRRLINQTIPGPIDQVTNQMVKRM